MSDTSWLSTANVMSTGATHQYDRFKTNNDANSNR